MDIRLGQERINAYFATFNAGDEVAHAALFHPDVAFFGSGSGDAVGLTAVRGVYHAAKGSLDFLEMHPLELYGIYPEMAARVEFRGRVKRFQAIVVFRFDEAGAIRRLSVIYNLRDAFVSGGTAAQ